MKIYHLALPADWEQAGAQGAYRGSALGRSLEDEGFVHCGFASQLRGGGRPVFRGCPGVVLLEIDPSLIGSEVRTEAVSDVPEVFPHVYGEIPLSAIVGTSVVALGRDGRLALDAVDRGVDF